MKIVKYPVLQKQFSRNKQVSEPSAPSGKFTNLKLFSRDLSSMSTILSSKTLFLLSSFCTVSCILACSSSTVDKRASACVILSVQSDKSFLVSSMADNVPSSHVENSDFKLFIAVNISSLAPVSSPPLCVDVASMLVVASLLTLCSMLCAPKLASFDCVCVFPLVFPTFGIL